MRRTDEEEVNFLGKRKDFALRDLKIELPNFLNLADQASKQASSGHGRFGRSPDCNHHTCIFYG